MHACMSIDLPKSQDSETDMKGVVAREIKAIYSYELKMVNGTK